MCIFKMSGQLSSGALFKHSAVSLLFLSSVLSYGVSCPLCGLAVDCFQRFVSDIYRRIEKNLCFMVALSLRHAH